jgi:predicted nucleic acid-binding protein
MALTDVVGAGPVGVDTSLFIYLIEEHPKFLPIVRPLFAEADAGRRQLVTSAVTLLEVLVVPFRAGDRALAARYEALLAGSRGLTLVDIDRVQLRAAAQLRAAHALRTPDALQVAEAVSEGCAVLVTNDRALRPVPGLQVIQLTRHM